MGAEVVAFASGKGGTGKSTSAVLVGAALAALGKRVVLIELAPSLRSVDIIAGVSELVVFDLEDILSGGTAPSKAVVESPIYEGLSIIPAPYQGGRIIAESMELLCARFGPHFDFILLDVAAGFGSAFEAAAFVANQMLLVETADPVALRCGRLMVDTIGSMPIKMRLILNNVNPYSVMNGEGLEDLDEAIDIVGLQLLGVVPESEDIRRAANTGTALPKNGREEKVFQAIARRMLGEDVPLMVQS